MKYLSFLGLLALLLCFTSCDSNNDEIGNVKIGSIKGLVEKGPFISGSSVNVYELDNNFNATGRVFEAKTDNEGAFSINASTSFVSKYVKLSVNGFYFNEYTGNLSDAPISLDAITCIDDVDNASINVNILTHLEMPRVLELISLGKDFVEAKEQAQQELLDAFLITDITIVPEETSITANNTSANILIAISSILLNERTDAQFSEFMNILRNDLIDGEISQESKMKIADSSLGLSYSKIKKNIKNRYEELGKTVEVGDFELFIDGDGDGQIGETYEEDKYEDITLDDLFSTEENVKLFCNGLLEQLYSFIQNQYLFDAVYTNTIAGDNLNRFNNLALIYKHNLTSEMNEIHNLWGAAYRAININNILIDESIKSNFDWFKKYQYYAKTYRAYTYLSMIDLWGDVPLVLSSNIRENMYVERNSQNEILDSIIRDLEDAYLYLPENSNRSECSRYFAKVIQAKAHLYKKEYSKALDCVNLIIQSGRFSLSNDVNAIYAGNNTENIFELPNTDDNLNIAYKELIQKGSNIAVCRYAEILLIASEVNMRLGHNQQAINYLNQVRNRNERTQISGSSAVEDALLNEWREDLVNEGLWFSTLKRFGKAEQVLDIPEYKLLLPIPYREMVTNPKMIQNPGY